MNVARWLRDLGLQQYQAAFRDNAIDDAVLLNLTAEDLKDLGVSLVGHRRKLLDAIAALRMGRGTDAAPHDVLPILDNAAADSAERRQVTGMFSDLVGSAALATRMDPEGFTRAYFGLSPWPAVCAFQVAPTPRRGH